MTDAIKRILDRFPDFRDRVTSLDEPGSHFNTLCHEFERVEGTLAKLEGASESDALPEAERLRRRRDALEQELLAMMQQTQRV